MQLTAQNVRQYLTDFDTVRKEFCANVHALRDVSQRMEELKYSYPQLYDSYCNLAMRAEIEMKILKRIGLLRACFNPLNIFDVAASLGLSRWMADCFIFSRRLNAVMIQGAE